MVESAQASLDRQAFTWGLLLRIAPLAEGGVLLSGEFHPSGNWTFTPSTPLPNGTVVNATATDPSGNASSPASVTVDAVAPATPVVNPSNGTTLSGTAEPGATVTLTDTAARNCTNFAQPSTSPCATWPSRFSSRNWTRTRG